MLAFLILDILAYSPSTHTHAQAHAPMHNPRLPDVEPTPKRVNNVYTVKTTIHSLDGKN